MNLDRYHFGNLTRVFLGILVFPLLMPSVNAAVTGIKQPLERDNATADLANATFPNPDLEPDEIVQIQIEALRQNDHLDRGIEIVFRFASPANKQHTGPLDRFAKMIKDEPYEAMLNHLDADYSPVETRDDYARQWVTILGPDAKTVTYMFYLSRQSQDPYADCWMTDAVFPILKEEGPFLPNDLPAVP